MAEGLELGAYRFTKYFTGERKPKANLTTVSVTFPTKLRPTAKAAIQEPCHRSMTVWPCLVCGGTRPSLVNVVDLQPAVMVTRPTARAVRGSQRRSWRPDTLRPDPLRRG